MSSVTKASPLEIAALHRLQLLSASEVGEICMGWLESGQYSGDLEIAALAGATYAEWSELAKPFDRVLQRLTTRELSEDEAILRALRRSLTVALETEPLREGVALLLARFIDRAERRLVRHPRRASDHPDGVYAQEELGLEYIYGCYYAFDDLQHMGGDSRFVAASNLERDLRVCLRELRDHLTALLQQVSVADEPP